MKKAFAGVLVLLTLSYAVFENRESGARADGLAGAFTAVADDATAILFNPAGLNQVQQINLYAFYSLLYSGLDENLHIATLSGTLPLPGRFGTAGISVQEAGFSLSSERCLTLSHGFGLAKDLNLGYSLIGYNVAIQGLGQAFAFGIDLGLHARVARRWTVGFVGHNLNMPQIGVESRTYLPRRLDVGLAYSPAHGITSTVMASKEVGRATRIAVGQEFEIVENLLTLRAGVHTEPVRFTFGIGTGVKNIRVDYALLTHSDLPLTHNLGLSVLF